MEESVVSNGTKPSIRRSISSAAPEFADRLCVTEDQEKLKKSTDGIRKAASMDSGETGTSKKGLTPVGSFKRRSIRVCDRYF